MNKHKILISLTEADERAVCYPHHRHPELLRRRLLEAVQDYVRDKQADKDRDLYLKGGE